jgi:hypothetical protein
MEELIARHATTAEVEAHADATTEEDFLSHNE